MPTIGMGVDIAELVDATIAENSKDMIAIARDLLHRGAPAAELAGRAGLIAAAGDSDGHAILTLDAAAALSRWMPALPLLPDQDPQSHEQELPLLVQALVATASALREGNKAQVSYPDPLFPSELEEGKTVDEAMHEAVYSNDATRVERLLFGLYGTGADYRTMEVRTYDGISTTFQLGGHPLMCAVRGFQLLDAVEWGDRAPHILHWLTPHLPLHSEEPEWIQAVRAFHADPAHSLASLRTRLSAPKDVNALPLRGLIQSDADTTQICQAVYDALIKGGASSRGVGSVIALAATDLMQRVGNGDRDEFLRAAHGLLFAAAASVIYSRVQDIAALPLLFTAAASANALYKDLSQDVQTAESAETASTSTFLGGGLIAPALLETLSEQVEGQDYIGAVASARRYLQLDNDPRALFATIGLLAARADAATDAGHTLQIVQAAGEVYLAWPTSLNNINIDTLLLVALRAATFARRNAVVDNL
ncbi:MAG TPA: hypothetical protein VKP04_01605 [Ktedonobacteraceae bacterium]|nr:hypothetical protein [Ktedonobacteraceae bacterium]